MRVPFCSNQISAASERGRGIVEKGRTDLEFVIPVFTTFAMCRSTSFTGSIGGLTEMNTTVPQRSGIRLSSMWSLLTARTARRVCLTARCAPRVSGAFRRKKYTEGEMERTKLLFLARPLEFGELACELLLYSEAFIFVRIRVVVGGSGGRDDRPLMGGYTGWSSRVAGECTARSRSGR
jgi:hypothetical protein